MLILGLESSCDDTAAALVEDGVNVLANVVSSQIEHHKRFGGVVPEIASRKHLENILPVLEQSLAAAGKKLDDLDAVAVTCGPGLMGSLLVGVCTAKAVAYAARLPLIPVNHLEGHLAALQLGERPLAFPYVGLVASGGHSSLYLVEGHGKYRLLGQTRDDAVGEAFDKVAKVMRLGYPGGPVIDRLAAAGDPRAIRFPRTYLEKDSYDFSFSGIKTAVWYYAKKQMEGREGLPAETVRNIAAAFQEAVVEVLVAKTVRAARDFNTGRVGVSGGVACNSALRKQMGEAAAEAGLEFCFPEPRFCTDNAAMTAAAGYHRYRRQGAEDCFLVDAAFSFPL